MSLSREQLWQAIVKQNPAFPSDGADFAPEGLRKFFDLVWNEAHKRGKDDKKFLDHVEDAAESIMSGKTEFADMLKDIFRGKEGK